MSGATASIVWVIVIGFVLITLVAGIATVVSVRLNTLRVAEIEQEHPDALAYTAFASARANTVLKRMLTTQSHSFRRLPQRFSLVIRNREMSLIRRTGTNLETILNIPANTVESIDTGTETVGRITYETLVLNIVGTSTTYSLALRLAGPKGVGNATYEFATEVRGKIVARIARS
jgi:hypothetical protein